MEPKEKKAFEPTGLVPRSIVRTFERFRQQLLPGSERAAIREYRISRYQVLVSARCLFALLTIPIATNWFVSSWLLSPIIEHFWNTQQNEIFLNSYQEERAFAELEFFSDKLFFESLLSNDNANLNDSRFSNIEIENSLISFADHPKYFLTVFPISLKNHWIKSPLFFASPMHTEGDVKEVDLKTCFIKSKVGDYPLGESPLFLLIDHHQQVGTYPLNSLGISFADSKINYVDPMTTFCLSKKLEASSKEGAKKIANNRDKLFFHVGSSQFSFSEKSYKVFDILKNDSNPLVFLKYSEEPFTSFFVNSVNTRSMISQRIKKEITHKKIESLEIAKSKLIHFTNPSEEFDAIPLEIPGVCCFLQYPERCFMWSISAKSLNQKIQEFSLPFDFEYQGETVSPTFFTTSGSIDLVNDLLQPVQPLPPTPLYYPAFSSSIKSSEQLTDIWNINTTEDSIKIKERIQEKILELAVYYNQQTILSITNVAGDIISVFTLGCLFIWMKPEISILKSFLIEAIYSLSDTTKSFLLILLTDLLVGFHSPRGWETALELLLKHFGLPENQDFVFLFVATFPVLLDTVFKYWIFRHLNKISPSTVATYHSMIE